MANKQVKHTYTGMNQDLTKSKFPPNLYFEGKNIRIISTNGSTTGSVTNEKGNTLILTIPQPSIDKINKKIVYGAKTLTYTTSEIESTYATAGVYRTSGVQTIIGNSSIRNGVILITTDELGFDCIWKLTTSTFDLKLLYMRNLGFTKNKPVQVLNNFENDHVDKIYWIDGVNQLRFINVEQSIVNQDLEELIDIPLSVIDMVGKATLSQPTIVNTSSGGSHTAGMIQYAYNLYRVNSSQTKISPLSELISLDNASRGGGLVNELVGTTPVIEIKNIDPTYTNIKVYSIKYTSYNEVPTISLIDDREIPSLGNIELFDDGVIIETLSLEEFIFLGSDIIIPKNINTKFNRMFFANYNELNFDVDVDTRAYAYTNAGTATVYDNLFLDNTYANGTPFTISTDADYDSVTLIKHDSVNLNYTAYKYQKDGVTLGGEGKYLKYELTQSIVFNKKNKYFKDDEIYRIGIEFFNAYGQVSEPKWIADIKSRDGNLKGNYNTLKVTLKPSFFTWLSTNSFENVYDKPVGYKIIIAERTINDRTIIANGLLSTMMIDHKTTSQSEGDTVPTLSKVNSIVKMPNILIRNCNATSDYGIIKPLHKASHLKAMVGATYSTSEAEVQRARYGDKDTAGRPWQYNVMLQMHSPEIMFGDTMSIGKGIKLRIKGSLKNTNNNVWVRSLSTVTSEILDEGKGFGGISPIFSTTKENIMNNADSVLDRGLIGHPAGSDPEKVAFSMFSREYGNLSPSLGVNTAYTKAPTNTLIDVYGSPEFTEKGQDGTNYNNDPNYRYINSLEGFLSDGDSGWADSGKHKRKIVSINSHGNRCVTIVTGADDSSVLHSARPKLETIFSAAGLSGNDNGLIGELVKTDVDIYLGNIYGGNSYEDKKRSNYIQIGNFTKFNAANPSIIIDSPGDTFVNNFKFARIVHTDTRIVDQGVYVLEEVVQFLTETTVDLKNRSDLSINSWDARFQPDNDEYHNYNKVYSQKASLIKNRALNYNTKKYNNFDTNILASKVKSSGEIIDSWTDIQVNEVLSLDGKYGSINALTAFNDEIYAIQDSAIAFISVAPRVQVQGEDGLAIELGNGSVLDRYKYVSTTSGTLNKWSVCNSASSLYFYDALNSSISMFTQGVGSLSDAKGIHSYFTNNMSLDSLKIDNPLIKKGISSSYDFATNDMYMTFHQTKSAVDTSFTVAFNEQSQTFTSFYDYKPSTYVSKGDIFLTSNPTNTAIYQQGTGVYNNFYGVNYPSYITLVVNPEADMDTVFDNIMFKSEVSLNDVDQPDKTLTKLQMYNEYQNSGLIPLTVGRNANLKRKFRDWNAILPRNAGTRQRIRNPWVYLKLQFDNTTDLKLVLHDIVISYTV